jgi:hypothetical protein
MGQVSATAADDADVLTRATSHRVSDHRAHRAQSFNRAFRTGAAGNVIVSVAAEDLFAVCAAVDRIVAFATADLIVSIAARDESSLSPPSSPACRTKSLRRHSTAGRCRCCRAECRAPRRRRYVVADIPSDHVVEFVANGHQGPRTGELENSRAIPTKFSDGTFERTLRVLLEKAVELGYDAIDLHQFFFDLTAAPANICPRWASIGHGVAFEAVMTSQFNCEGVARAGHCFGRQRAPPQGGNSLRRKYD